MNSTQRQTASWFLIILGAVLHLFFCHWDDSSLYSGGERIARIIKGTLYLYSDQKLSAALGVALGIVLPIGLVGGGIFLRQKEPRKN